MKMLDSILAARLEDSSPAPDGYVALAFRFAATQPVFSGHFPGRPLVPGVFLLEITRVAAESAMGRKLEVREVVKAKFLRPIIPEEMIRVELKCVAKGAMIEAHARFSVMGQRAGEAILFLALTA